MKSKLWIYATVLLLILNMGTITMLWKPRWERGNRNEAPRPERYMAKKLGLSGDQIAKMKELRQSHFQEIKQLEKQIFKTKLDIFEQNKSKTPISKVTPELRNVGQLQMRIDSLTYVHFSEMRAICTLDQQEKFNELLTEMMKRRFGAPPPRQGGREFRIPRDQKSN